MSSKLCSSATDSLLIKFRPSPIHRNFRNEVFVAHSGNLRRRIPHLLWSREPPNAARRLGRVLSMADKKSVAGNWVAWVPQGAMAERVFRLIAGAMSSPVGQFVSSPSTFLHSVDPRVKLVILVLGCDFEAVALDFFMGSGVFQVLLCFSSHPVSKVTLLSPVQAWLLALVVLPARSHIVIRFGLVIFLAVLSVWILPKHVWRDQLSRVALLSGILFVMLGFGSDGAPPLVQSRTLPPSTMGLPTLPVGAYSYSIIKLGPLLLTRKGLSVASTSACLSFTIFQSASLCLTTTTPEQLASALQWFMHPLKLVGVPVAEIILTLLLSLRFISLVFDEVRNAAMAIVSRRINWQQLTVMETLDIFVMYVWRIFKNIIKHAEQISQAMIVRGFRGDSNLHKIYFFSNSSVSAANIVSIFCLLGLIGASIVSELYLV